MVEWNVIRGVEVWRSPIISRVAGWRCGSVARISLPEIRVYSENRVNREASKRASVPPWPMGYPMGYCTHVCSSQCNINIAIIIYVLAQVKPSKNPCPDMPFSGHSVVQIRHQPNPSFWHSIIPYPLCTPLLQGVSPCLQQSQKLSTCK